MIGALLLRTVATALLYVPNQSSASITVIDASTGKVVATVDLKALGFTANAKPHHVVVQPDGSYWYVSLIGDNLVVKFDRKNVVRGRVSTPTPGMLALDATHDRLYASRSMTAVNPPSTVAVIRPSDMTLVTELDVIVPRPHAIALDPRGTVYVGGLGGNQIAAIDAKTERVSLSEIDGPTNVYAQFAVSPDGKRLVATGQLTSTLLAFDATDPTALKPIVSVPIARSPYDLAFAPDGKSVWIANQLGNVATEVDAETWKVAAVVQGKGFAEPHGVAIAADGRTVYVSNHGHSAAVAASTDTTMAAMHADHGDRHTGTVVIIDAATRTVRAVIEVGEYAAGLGIGGGR